MNAFRVDFEGFWSVGDRDRADRHGIYAVYAVTPESMNMIYIGHSHCVGQSISDHPGLDDWKLAASDHPMRFSVGDVESQDGLFDSWMPHVAEAAMIHHYKPICNEVSSKYEFKHGGARVINTGPVGILNRDFAISA